MFSSCENKLELLTLVNVHRSIFLRLWIIMFQIMFSFLQCFSFIRLQHVIRSHGDLV